MLKIKVQYHIKIFLSDKHIIYINVPYYKINRNVCQLRIHQNPSFLFKSFIALILQVLGNKKYRLKFTSSCLTLHTPNPHLHKMICNLPAFPSTSLRNSLALRRLPFWSTVFLSAAAILHMAPDICWSLILFFISMSCFFFFLLFTFPHIYFSFCFLLFYIQIDIYIDVFLPHEILVDVVAAVVWNLVSGKCHKRLIFFCFFHYN